MHFIIRLYNQLSQILLTLLFKNSLGKFPIVIFLEFYCWWPLADRRTGLESRIDNTSFFTFVTLVPYQPLNAAAAANWQWRSGSPLRCAATSLSSLSFIRLFCQGGLLGVLLDHKPFLYSLNHLFFEPLDVPLHHDSIQVSCNLSVYASGALSGNPPRIMFYVLT